MVSVQLQERYVCWKWSGGNYYKGGWWWYGSPSGFHNRTAFNGMWPDAQYGSTQQLDIPLDPFTAINLGLVTPEELEFPPAMLAWFQMLKGNS